jgi:hypothetical protein
MVAAEIMPRSATTQTRPMATQAIDDRNEHGHVGGVAGPHLRADRPALGVDHHAHDHLHQVGAVVL